VGWNETKEYTNRTSGVYRDGQEDKVVAYFLVAEAGADPIMAEVLGIKRMQSEPVNNPNTELVEELAIDGDNVKRLAEAYLQQIGANQKFV
jgi:hypothetical protein